MEDQEKSAKLGNEQKFTWKTIATYSTFEAADEDRNERRVGGGKRLKVKRRGDKFELRMGTPIARKEKVWS